MSVESLLMLLTTWSIIFRKQSPDPLSGYQRNGHRILIVPSQVQTQLGEQTQQVCHVMQSNPSGVVMCFATERLWCIISKTVTAHIGLSP